MAVPTEVVEKFSTARSAREAAAVIADAFANAVGASGVLLHAQDARDQLSLLGARGLSESEIRAAEHPSPTSLQAQAARGREHIDATGEEFLYGTRRSERIRVVPLMGADRVIGVVTMVGGRDVDAAALRALVDVAALALDRARLDEAGERARARTGALGRAAEAFAAALSPSEVGDVIRAHALPVLGATAFALAVPGAGLDEVVVVSDHGFREAAIEGKRRVPLSSTSAIARAAHSRRAVWRDERDQTGDPFRDAAGTHGRNSARAAALPLVVKDQLLGVLLFTYPASSSDDFATREMTETFAHQAALALERARLYRASREAALRADAATRAKDEFLSVVSHELRTPLNVIVGWSHLLAEGASSPEVLRRGLETIRRNAVAEAHLVEAILDVSRIVTGKIRLSLAPVDLAPLVRGVVEGVRPAAEARSIEIVLDLEADCLVLGDAERLAQAVSNILTNAIKFSSDGGRVSVSLACSPSHVELTVSDAGAGIDPAVLPFIFDGFRQADATMTRAHAGLGLGLAMVRHLVEAHGGQVRAASEGPRRGSTFRVTLPRREASSPAVAPPARAPEATASEHPRLIDLRVLIVDDQADARELFELVLTQQSARVMTVASAEEAMRAIASFEPHVLISDISMPGDDGITLINRVRALGPPLGLVPAIATTSYARPEEVRAALGAGFTRHMAKPIVPSVLADLVASVAGRK